MKAIFTLLTITVTSCLLWQCLALFYSPDGFTPDAVAAGWRKIWPGIVAWGVFLLTSLIVKVFLPPKESALRPVVGEKMRTELPIGAPVRLLMFAAAAVLIALGVLNGGMRATLVKAITICSECIGLG